MRGTCIAIFVLSLTLPSVASAADLKATYRFQNNLTADEPSVPALTLTDPQGLCHFETATVFGQSRTVFAVDGDPTNELQAGLTFLSAGHIPTNNYSVELVFEFLERPNGWRRILDVQDRQFDNGFYVDPFSRVYIYPVIGSSDTFTNDNFHYVVLTNDHQTNTAYLDGHFELQTSTPVMDIENPNSWVHIFLDNVVGGGQEEYSDARIALVRFSEGILSQAEVAARAVDPFAPCNPSRGDLNGDSTVNADDVGAFVNVLLGNDTSPGHVSAADVDCNGHVDGRDIQAFVQLSLM